MSKNIHNSEINGIQKEVRFPLRQTTPNAPQRFPSHHYQEHRHHHDGRQQHGYWQQLQTVRNNELYYKRKTLDHFPMNKIPNTEYHKNRFPLEEEPIDQEHREQLHMTPKISHVYFNQQQFFFPHNIQHTQMPKNDLSFPSRISSMTSINQQKQRQQQQQLAPASIRSNEVVVHMESPTIKYQFVNLLNNLYGKWVNADVAGHGNRSSQPTPATTPTDLTDLVPSPKTTTTTLASMTASTSQHDEITEIDMDEKETHCRTFDNEPNALEQIKTFNLNVKVQQEDEEQRLKEKEALAKGVGEQKMEIEHQQAENFNDAFGRRQRHDDDHCYDYSVDAMDVAKNKHELYEQSKLERNQQKESRDELNMNKAASKILANEEHNEWTPRECQRQRVESICLASNREQTIDEYGTASNHQLLAVDLSDTRETSSEQVDEQQQQLRHHHHHHRQQHQQHQHQQYQPHVKSNGSIVTRPNIEIFKSAVHAFLAAGECACSFPLARKEFDLELIDFLSDIIEVLFSSVGAVGQTKQVATSCECADMTVSKVSEEQDSEAAAIVVAAAVEDVYPDQIDSPSEVEDNNNNNNNNISSNNIIKIRNDNQQIDNMKYELKPTVATTTTLPLASSNRHATSVHPSTLEASPTSRIRNNLETPATAVRSTPLLLGDLKRSSSSRDDLSESVLPERTRLRRQRRMRSQDSVEEKPEDVIERLNKLKARISGALSEVKGVLKQYSTESESETTTQPAIVKATDTATATSLSAAASAAPVPPAVAFRFVKKVRRRSCFDEAEEEKEQESESNQSAPTHEEKQEKKDKDEHEKEEQKTKLSAVDTVKVNLNEEKLNTEQNSAEKLKGLAAENDTNETQKQSDVPTTSPPPPTTAVPGHVTPTPPTTATSVQTKIDFLKKVRSELKGKPANEENGTTEMPTAATEAPSTTTTTTMPTPLPSESITLDSTVADVTPAREKIKKKIIVKAKNPRRASIAAVEPSKIQIEPLVAHTDALHTQRRPSDSEAIVKRKKEKLMGARATPTTTISSGIAKETTNIRQQPKQQQKPATTTTPTNEQLSTPKVNNADAIPAKIKTKSLAKSDKGDEAATVSIPANTGVTDKSTPAASTTEGGGGAAAATTQPEQINIDGVDTNQVQTTDRTSHNHTAKVAELVIAEPPVVVVVVVPPPAGSSNNAGEDTTSHISSSPVISSSLSESKKPINQSDASSFEAPPTPDHLVAIAGDIEDAAAAAAAEKSAPPQIAATLSEVSHEESSLQQQSPQQQQQQSESVADTKDKTHTDTSDSLAAMPELKVLSGPVQPVKIETVVDQANDETKNGNQQQISVTKKKTPHLKKLVRKNSIDKDKDKDKEKEKEKDEQTNNDDKLKNILRNKNKITELSSRLNKLTPPKKIAKPSQEGQQQVVTIVKEQKENGESEINAEVIDDDQQTGTEVEDELSPLTEPEPEPEPQPEPIPAPKQRKIKKKVIIKRQKRRLSISDSFFIQPETEEPKVPEIETIEKAIAYVTDDEVDNQEPDEADTAKPLKSCLHVREYKIGDLVLYAERYRKTQVRWKRGRVLERITSISYKLEIEGKEVAAHISYIKKYTGRKVRFGGKEYLEIDYEQVAEEERRARSYSIWNMV